MMKERRKKKHLPVLRFLFYTAFIFVLLWFFQSNFFIARIALPLTANYYGMTLSVSNAGLKFLNNNTLFADDLMLIDDYGNELTVKRAEIRLSLPRLLRGDCHIHDATLREISLNIVNPASETGNMTIPDPARFRIGPVHMSNIMISYGQWKLHIHDLQASGALANTNNVLHSSGVLYNSKNHRLPVKLSLQWNRHAEQWLNSFTGTLELLPGTGRLFQRDLADFHFRLLLSGQKTKEDLIQWRTTVESAGIGPTKDVLCRTTGHFDPSTLKGSFKSEMTGHFSEAEIRKGAGLFLGEQEVPIPENLTLQKFVCNGQFDRNTFHWDCDLTATLDRLWFEGKEYLSSTRLDFSNTGSFQFSKPELHLQELNMELKSAKASLSIKNKGDFIFHHDHSGWHVIANNSELQMGINELPANLLNVLLPMEITGGIINGQYRMAADSRHQRLKGAFQLTGKGVAISLSDKQFIEPQTIALRMDLESTGLEKIKSLTVRKCAIRLDNEKQEKVLRADLNGTWYFKDSRLDLNGDMKIFTFPATAVVHDPFIREIHRYLKKNHYEDIINHSRINMSMILDPEVEQNQLKMQLDTTFNSFIFLGERYKDHPLNLSLKAESSFSSSAMTIRFPSARLYLKGLTDISGSGSCSFPAGDAQFHVKLNSFTSEFCNSLAKAAKCKSDHVKYKSLTGFLDFSLSSKDETFRLRKGAFTFIPADGASAQLNLDREVFSLWKNLQKTDIPMTLKVKDMPLSWWNCLLPHSTTFRFFSGMGNCQAEVTAKNLGRDIYISLEGTVADTSLGVGDTVWGPGPCKAKGTISFPDYFREIKFHSLKLTALDGGKDYLTFLTDGFAGIDADRETSLCFTFLKTTPEFLYRLCCYSKNIPTLQQFDLTGKFTYDADASYDKNFFTWDMKINELTFKEKDPETLPPLNGRAKMKLQILPDSFSFHDTAILLKDKSNNTRFDLSSDLIRTTEEKQAGVKYYLRANTLDLLYLLRVLTADPEKVKNVNRAMNKVKRTGPDGLHSFIRKFRDTKVIVDLKNIMFTKHLNMMLKGKASFTDHGIKTDSIRWNVNQKGETDLFADVTILENGDAAYHGQFTLRNISVVPFLDAFAVYKNKKLELLEGLKGEIKETNLKFSGRGFSKNAMEKNLKIDLQAKFRDLSIPPGAKKVSVIVRILLFPLEQVPGLINKIKYQPAKVILQNVMGEHINAMVKKQNLEFKKGHVVLRGKEDHFTVEKMLFTGPSLRFDVIKGHIQPFRNKMFLDTLIRVGTMSYPLVFDCPLDEPDYNINITLQRWLTLPQKIIQPKK